MGQRGDSSDLDREFAARALSSEERSMVAVVRTALRLAAEELERGDVDFGALLKEP